MKKTLYSLMLSEDVVHEVDRLAHRLGTNRSNLINQILAEYVDMVTPERRINDIFSAIENLVSPSRELVPFFTPNNMTMSLKSNLEYKYRPTIKYEVELYRTATDSIGELSVIFRTQSVSLIKSMTDFFRLWKLIEDRNLSPMIKTYPVTYSLSDGKFTRSITVPNKECSSDELAQVISDYITFFDSMMKGFLTDRLTPQEIEGKYIQLIEKSPVII